MAGQSSLARGNCPESSNARPLQREVTTRELEHAAERAVKPDKLHLKCDPEMEFFGTVNAPLIADSVPIAVEQFSALPAEAPIVKKRKRSRRTLRDLGSNFDGCTFIPKRAVIRIFGGALDDRQLGRMEEKRKFQERVYLSAYIVVWIKSEIDEWIEKRKLNRRAERVVPKAKR